MIKRETYICSNIVLSGLCLNFQMADNAEVLKLIKRRDGVTYAALTPNLKGLKDAVSYIILTYQTSFFTFFFTCITVYIFVVNV